MSFNVLPTGPRATTLKVELDGNFFKRDPKKTVRGNIRDMLDKLAIEMEGEVRRQTESHAGQMPYSTGWTADHVKGFVTWGGNRWQFWAAVQAYTQGMDARDAIRTKAAAASVERRFHPYRSVKGGIYRSKAIFTANLTEGLE